MSSYAALYMADSSPQNIMLNSYCGVASLVLLVYEYIITFDKEVDLFWRGSTTTRASALFLFNRYLSLVAIALPRFTMQRMQPERSYRCKELAYAFETLDILSLLPWIILSSLRAFALSEVPYRWVVTTLVVALALVPVALNMTQYHWLITSDGQLGCLAKLTITANMGKKFTLICRICTICSDLVVLSVAVNATYKSSKLVRRAMGSRNSPIPRTFTGTILRGGAIYFIVFLILNVAHLVFTWLSLDIDSLSALSFITIFTQPLVAILISRFLLNLQEVKQRLASPRSLPHIGSIHLRPLGSLQELGPVEVDSPPADDGTGEQM